MDARGSGDDMSDEAGKYTNDQAVDIIETEGLGYAVTDYCRGSSFADPETAKLWDAARDALRSLVRYVEDRTGREVD
jgi:hypothetical protein